MSAAAITDLSKLCIHTITTKPWSLEKAIGKYSKKGIKGISVWRQWLDENGPEASGKLLRDAGMDVVSLVRGGFFPGETAEERQKAIDDNKKALDEAAAIGAPSVVLVCGAVPGQALTKSRKQITEGIASVLEHAASVDVKLSIEPLHPMYADTRSAVNTMKQANDICDALNSPFVGVAVDVYHVWWDPDLCQEIERCGKSGYLFAFHICDWMSPTVDLLNDRGLMGEGCINIREIRGWVEDAGFTGYNEVEIFSNRWWKKDQDEFLDAIVNGYLQHS
jgi:sugar phosphate isomerase/epimerase